MHLNVLTDVANSQLPEGASRAELLGRWNHDGRTWLMDSGWMVLIFGIEMSATLFVLRRRDPALLGSAVPRTAAPVAPAAPAQARA